MNALQTIQPKSFDLSPQTFEQALTFAGYLAESNLVPKDFIGKPGNCLVAIQWGMELGLKPLQCMQNIAVINGRPSLWGDAVLALVLASPSCKDVIERYEGTGEHLTAVCIAQRHGRADKEARFSVADAKAAGLLGKQGPWQQYRDRMLKMRARAFALRDQFADVLKGMEIAEEAMDAPAERHMGTVEVVQPEAPKTYPVDQFEKNLPVWRKVIADGKKTADQIIAMAQSKFPLTAEQQAAIRAPAAAPAAPAAASPAGPTDADGVIHPVKTFDEVMAMLCAATTEDALYVAADWIETIADADAKALLNGKFDERLAQVRGAA